MSPTQAIDKARADVRLVNFGNNQCVVQSWSTKHNATWQSHHMDYRSGVNALRAARIRYALEQLGWDHEDATYEGMKDEDDCGGQRRKWDQVVRMAAHRGCV